MQLRALLALPLLAALVGAGVDSCRVANTDTSSNNNSGGSVASGSDDGSSTSSSSNESSNKSESDSSSSGRDVGGDGWWKPTPGTSYEIQLAGTLNLTYDVDMYDIDLFDTPEETIAGLQQRGIKVVCYFSAGTYENWRSDKDEYTQAMIGNALPEWEGEYWVDTTNEDLRAILKTRMELAKSKGCDGVDPDNVDGAFNDPGFDLTADTQLDFNRFLAETAHALGLSVGLKNDLAQVEDLVDVFDFAVNEQCVAYDECEMLSPFISANKPVFGIEYDGDKATICEEANALNFDTLYKSWDLRGDRYSCR